MNTQVPGGHFMHREHPEPFLRELVRASASTTRARRDPARTGFCSPAARAGDQPCMRIPGERDLLHQGRLFLELARDDQRQEPTHGRSRAARNNLGPESLRARPPSAGRPAKLEPSAWCAINMQ